MGQLQLQVCDLVRYKLKEERRKPKSDGHLIKLTITLYHSWITWGGAEEYLALINDAPSVFHNFWPNIFSSVPFIQLTDNIYCISLKKSDPVFLFFPLHSLSKMNVINVSISFEKITQHQKVLNEKTQLPVNNTTFMNMTHSRTNLKEIPDHNLKWKTKLKFSPLKIHLWFISSLP